MKKGFTFIEMIFVIVILGILAKFGSEIFRNVYLSYNQSVTNNKLQVDTENSIQQIANRLQYRIKNSVIARDSTGPANDFKGLSSALATDNFDTLEWIGYDIDGWLGDSNTSPTWSGFIDVDANAVPNINLLSSPSSDFLAAGRADTVIQAIGGSSIANAAIFFSGATSDVRTDYGWDGTAQNEQNSTASHLIASAAAVGTIIPGVDDFSAVDVYEQYKLAWTAYALELNATTGNLTLYYDYQPWQGEGYKAGTPVRIMENVSTFKFQGVGDMIKLQLCVDDNNFTGDEYSLCKEKAIF